MPTKQPTARKAARKPVKPAKPGTKPAKAKTTRENAPQATVKGNKAQALAVVATGKAKPGIIASLVEFLQAATAAKPITKADMLAKLCKRFPEREPSAMQRTIGCQIPGRIAREQNIVVKSNDRGFWSPSK